MRVIDDRYAGELDKFDLAVRMIGMKPEPALSVRARALPRTGFASSTVPISIRSTDRACGRRRGKSPRQIGRFVSSARRQSESTLLACLFLLCGVFTINQSGRALRRTDIDPVNTGSRLCQAYEMYLGLYPNPGLSFEWAWNLFSSLVKSHELFIARLRYLLGLMCRTATRSTIDAARCANSRISTPGRKRRHALTPAGRIEATDTGVCRLVNRLRANPRHDGF